MLFANIIRRFNVYGYVHCKYIPIYVYIQQVATLHSLFISGNCSTCFGWYFHPSSEAHTNVSTASGICHTVTALCRYRGRVGTSLNVLWVAYATHSTFKLVPMRMRNVSDTTCKENNKTPVHSVICFPKIVTHMGKQGKVLYCFAHAC
jgi:hypothetical protein